MRTEIIKEFKCEFCGKDFSRERTLINHVCEQKRRWMQRNEKPVRLAFNSWLRWYELTKTNKHKKTRTYKDFMKSKEYTSFVKFGRHVVNTNLVNPSYFIDFVIKNNLKLKDWTKDSVFEFYARQVTRNEDIESALSRFIKLTEIWSQETGYEWTDFFDKVNTGQALHWIRTGRISPWVIYNSQTVELLLKRMTDEQIKYMNDTIEPAIWKAKMLKNKKDLDFVKNTLKECKI